MTLRFYLYQDHSIIAIYLFILFLFLKDFPKLKITLSGKSNQLQIMSYYRDKTQIFSNIGIGPHVSKRNDLVICFLLKKIPKTWIKWRKDGRKKEKKKGRRKERLKKEKKWLDYSKN